MQGIPQQALIKAVASERDEGHEGTFPLATCQYFFLLPLHLTTTTTTTTEYSLLIFYQLYMVYEALESDTCGVLWCISVKEGVHIAVRCKYDLVNLKYFLSLTFNAEESGISWFSPAEDLEMPL